MAVDLATRAVEIARGQLGVTEEPPGSNRGPMVDRYLREGGGLEPEGHRYPWCAAFASWCVRQAAAELAVLPRFHRAAGALRLLELNPNLALAAPEPNCIFVMDHGGGKGHAGLVYAVDVAEPDHLYTIEGNSDAAGSRTGGSVVLQERRASACAGFLRIA